MNKPLILMATSFLTTVSLLHFPSAAQEERVALDPFSTTALQGDNIEGSSNKSASQSTEEPIAPLQTFAVDADILNSSIL